MPALRNTPHRQVVETLLAAFPDTHILAAGTAFPPPASLSLSRAFIDDIDALLIATADPATSPRRRFTPSCVPAVISAQTGRAPAARGIADACGSYARICSPLLAPDLLGPGSPPPIAEVLQPRPRDRR